jgi:hypothetical protein
MSDFDPKAFLAQEETIPFDPKAFLAQGVLPKFAPDEDTQYTEAGIPLVAPSGQVAPKGGETAAKVMTDVVGAPVRAAMSIAKPVTNVMGWMGVEEPGKAVKQMDTGIKEQGPEFMGVQGPIGSVASLAGDIYGYNKILGGLGLLGAPISKIPGAASVVNAISKSPLLQSTLGGGAVGVLGTESPTQVIKEGAIGAGLGALTHGALSGLGGALDPMLKRVKDLQAKGFTLDEIKKDTTIGQMLGGNTQAVENFFAAIPFSGAMNKIEKGAKSLQETLESKIKGLTQQEKTAENVLGLTTDTLKTAEQRALNDAKTAAERQMSLKQNAEKAVLKQTEADIHVPIINYALKPLGIEIKPGMTGNEAIKEGQKAISDAYNKALEGFSNLRITKNIQNDLNSLADTYGAGYLGKENASLFKNDIKRLIDDTAKGKWLTPDNWQRQLSKLSKEAYNMRTKDPRYSEALYELKDKWMDLVENQVGSDLFKAANTAFSKFKIPERAAAYGKSIKAGGEFSPDELINSLRAELGTKRLAGGEDEIQKLAVDAHNKIKASRATQEEKHNLEKQSLSDLFTQRDRTLQDKFTGMQETLAKQKAALKGQTETKKEGLEKGYGEAVGDIGKMVSYPEKRAIYQAAGLGGSGGLGFIGSQFGITPQMSAIALGIPWAASNILYRPGPVQTLLKEAALAPRSATARQTGQALKEIAPGASMATVQQNKENRRPGVQVYNPDTMEEITPPQGGLPVPR